MNQRQRERRSRRRRGNGHVGRATEQVTGGKMRTGWR
jgi:hypothetical protein